MKDQEVQTINESENKEQKKDVISSGSKESGASSPWKESLRTPSGIIGDIIKFVVAVIVASVVYWVSILIMSEHMNFFVRHLMALVIAFLVLVAFKSIQKTTPVIGNAVVICLILWFVYNISNHYFVPTKALPITQSVSAASTNSPIRIAVAIDGIKDSIFTKGTYYIDVKGETPFRINVVTSAQCNKYVLYPESGDKYDVVYEDETITDGPNMHTTEKYRAEPKFVLRASQATVKMVVN